ncbi:MarR family winged helix-turn-helix transcriptional regulator [Gordonia sp. SL306]|uniref:MarR family winged helix-turn-helix transcriptional regulator n=1 Tax=Gordonia sp. SL306 TaxID=2995145 RepID=UPI0022704B01|nr:MarR family winged helix-turn-helix transcriptional regulator [Gordonia sp. SL306]WAC55947.1 MarR family winged helix-turn-helix transcriptional regulator [Gordonia sp. SL306]
MPSEDPPRLLLRLLVEATRAFEDRVLDDLAIDGIRPAHFSVFRYLAPEGSRIGDLATAAGMTGQAMGELVGKVRELGLVDVVTDPADRRARLVRSTPRGSAAVAQYAEQVRAVEGRLRDEIGAAGLEELRGLLARAGRVLSEPSG